MPKAKTWQAEISSLVNTVQLSQHIVIIFASVMRLAVVLLKCAALLHGCSQMRWVQTAGRDSPSSVPPTHRLNWDTTGRVQCCFCCCWIGKVQPLLWHAEVLAVWSHTQITLNVLNRVLINGRLCISKEGIHHQRIIPLQMHCVVTGVFICEDKPYVK